MKNQKGFTLIELLVVISIIGLLSTLSVVALNNARMKSRDARRVSDVKQIQTALELYFNDNNGYPTAITAGESIGDYMTIVPANPTPRNDGDCGDFADYVYTATEADNLSNYKSYHIKYCLGGVTGGISAGTHYGTPASIQDP